MRTFKYPVAAREILTILSEDKLNNPANVAELRLSYGSLESHEASHITSFMLEDMAPAGTPQYTALYCQLTYIVRKGEVYGRI